MPSSHTALVLGGGPDRERPVSLKSAAAVANALREAGHTVIESDITPDDLSALDQSFDVVFPVLHGGWGEGGPLQEILEQRQLRYVGCGPEAAAKAMDKHAAKKAAAGAGVPTPPSQYVSGDEALTLEAPLVLKPLTEGSSVGVSICQTQDEVDRVREQMGREYEAVLAEKFVPGREITVGIVDRKLLPPIEIVPAEAFYDFHAKYEANTTRYEFDIDLPPAVLERMQEHALAVFDALGCRHLSRVDFLVSSDNEPWFLEINTMPGFTDHSLLPIAAKKAGMPMASLCDNLVRLALEE